MSGARASRVDTALFDEPLRAGLAARAHRLRGIVLDVGSGMQPYRHLAQPGATWIGLDLPSTWSGAPVAQIHGSGEVMPIRSGSIDAVLSTQVIEHMPHPWLFFHEVARVLRPGGTAIVSAPHAQWLHEEPHDYYRFTKYGMRQLAEDAGLCVIEIEPIGGAIALMGFLAGTHIPTLGRGPTHPWMKLRTVLQRFINATTGWLDRRLYAPSDTLGNLMVAERPE